MREETNDSYIRKGLYLKETQDKGEGVFSKKHLRPGDLAGIVSGGRIWRSGQVRKLVPEWGDYFHQVHETFHWGPKDQKDIDLLDKFNHSCDPSMVLVGNMTFKVIVKIKPDVDELTWDYALTESGRDYDFKCHCGSAKCRGRMSGNDWKRPDLQERYAGFFAPYLQEKINRMKGERA